jgi:hypothetical protein
MTSLGRFKIFTYVKPSETATMFSHQMAKFLSQELGEPLTWTDDIASDDLDTLIICAGGVAFCQHRDAPGRAVLRSERVVFVQNDYKSKMPKEEGKAETFYRKAFRIRSQRKMRPIDYWGTVPANVAKTPTSHLVNWNLLAWRTGAQWTSAGRHLLYYGSWRKPRLPILDNYLSKPSVDTLVCNSTGRYEKRYPDCRHEPGGRLELSRIMAEAGLGLYVKDPVARDPPACRFYEMLSAGLPMVFDAGCAEVMAGYGYDVAPFAVRGADDVPALVRQRRRLQSEQRAWIDRDFIEDVRRQLREAMSK